MTDTAAPASLMTGENAGWIDDLYAQWSRDPGSVEAEWAELFASWGEPEPGAGAVGPADFAAPSIFSGGGGDPAALQAHALQVARRQAGVVQLINAFRVRGHVEADIDPLGKRDVDPHPELTLGFYGLSDADLDVSVSGQTLYGVPEVTTLRHIVERCRKAYCSGFGVEFMNIGDIEKKRWLQRRIETLQDEDVLDRQGELHALRMLADAENFEHMLHTRFPGTKRFSLEGGETLIPLLDFMLAEAGSRGVDEVIFGMAHRGRLNVLANILMKPVKRIVDEFEGLKPEYLPGSGDVKYHLGYSTQYQTVRGDSILVSLAFNPSHLEAVNPVVEGRTRARQDRRGEGAYEAVMPLLIHGDAAFAGQGVVCETLNLSDLDGYRAGGTIHVIVNNQIGFTTSPKDSRSTPYATDVARMLAVPIFHVNGEDVEAVAAVARLAAEWRQTFHQDVVIDMYCYRQHGHNEGDEPSFTQPRLYETIRSKPSPRVVYARKMQERGDLTEGDVDRVNGESKDRLEAHLRDDVELPHPAGWSPREQIKSLWAQYRGGSLHDPVETATAKSRLVALLREANTLPGGFRAHRKIDRLLKQRLQVVVGERPVDWAVAEQAAYATLVDEGFRVRLSGQDSGRGTFSHRHAVLTDIETGEDLVPLARIGGAEGRFEVYDSLLSEAAVLGFEYGYSLEAPDTLVVWEAQFGDFANGGQVITDNFITSGEQKWDRMSGVVMLLPHGYEGQGPEHSSARLERYLQACAQDNIVVANCTTPANFFHLLRRQMHMATRKPLVVMAPKSLLRHPKCVSTIDDLAGGAFESVLGDRGVEPSGVRRVIFCSGKIYYDLLEARDDAGQSDVAVVRLEQLYPFPADRVRAEIDRYDDGVEVVWCQEEPRNMGAWPMMDEWFARALGGGVPSYVGRDVAASTATGFPDQHRAQHSRLIRQAMSFDGSPDDA
jgi:2-oxoglutarate dehydrogenase E1 component